MLHNDSELFRQIVLLTSESMRIDLGIIEKDYYVTMFLKSLVRKQPSIIFKGGTSLSKCYKLVKRFSEDIDITLECATRPSESQRRKLKENIVSVIGEFDFKLANPEQVRSRRDYNRYMIDFHSLFDYSVIRNDLIVESSVFIRAYPSKKMTASCLIYDFLEETGENGIIAQFSLEPFELNVQSLERTFIDKLFAVGDYYLDGRVTEHSRHIYDIYKIFNVITIDHSLKKLLIQVRRERSQHAACLSAQDDVNLKDLLQKIIDEKAYKSDYKTITENLLFEKVSYEEAVTALQKIVKSDLLNSV